MKKIAALVLAVSMLLLVSCSSILGGVKISSERVKEIVETIRENAEENDMLFVKERVYIPKVYLENEYDYDRLELNTHNETLKYSVF